MCVCAHCLPRRLPTPAPSRSCRTAALPAVCESPPWCPAVHKHRHSVASVLTNSATRAVLHSPLSTPRHTRMTKIFEMRNHTGVRQQREKYRCLREGHASQRRVHSLREPSLAALRPGGPLCSACRLPYPLTSAGSTTSTRPAATWASKRYAGTHLISGVQRRWQTH